MWMLKGILIGLVIYFIAALVYVGATKMGPIEEHKATSLTVFLGPTVFHLWWWTGLIATVALACWFFKARS